MHPVVEAFVKVDRPMLAALEGIEKRSPLLDALRGLFLARTLRVEPAEALAAAAAVSAEGEDPVLYLLFLEVWAAQSSRMRRRDEVTALLSRARSIASAEVPPELEAMLVHLEMEHDEAVRQIAPQGRSWREMLKLLPADSPRRWNAIIDQAFHLAQQGRLCEFESEFRALSDGARDPGKRQQLDVAKYLDCAECGRAAAAAECAARIDMQSTFVRGNLNGIVFAGMVLDLMAGRHVPEELADPGSADPVRQLRAADWAHSTYHLAAGRIAEALVWARRHAETFSGLHAMRSFPAMVLIRAELAAGNAEAGARLMRKRAEAMNLHYLDGLFLARIELLRGRRAEAAGHFAEVLAEVDRHDARGRLDFELRLARELSPGDVVDLTRTAGQVRPEAVTRPPEEEASLPDALARLMGRSPAMVRVREEIGRCAPLDVPVLITGETGTGKELAARALHEMSWRREMPFLAVNCGAISEPLLESELFGHEKGAFTGAASAHKGLFESAGEGTLLLDEIGEISPRLQVALLRVLEAGEIRRVGASRTQKVTCRLLAATNAPLEELVEQGGFRKDLYYRLKRLEIRLPALCERGGDVLLLAGHFLELDRPRGQHVTMTDALRAALAAYGWPGNVRELRNEVERMRLLSSEALSYDIGDLSERLRASGAAPHPGSVPTPAPGRNAPAAAGADLPDMDRVLAESRTRLRRMDRIRELFTQHGRLTRAEVTRALGVSPKTVTRDLRELVEEGFIERVEPSASSRSHYFRLRGASGR